MSKKLWFDTETTGVDPYRNDIVQLAGVIEIKGEIVEEFNFRCQPHDYKTIRPEALEITGLTEEEIKTYPAPGFVFNKVIRLFEKYIAKFDKNDKFTPCGHNVSFDLQMLQSWFKKCGDKYGTGAWQNWQAIDTMAFARIVDDIYPLDVPNFKLESLAQKFGIAIDAHDALSDIKATRELYGHLKSYYHKNVGDNYGQAKK